MLVPYAVEQLRANFQVSRGQLVGAEPVLIWTATSLVTRTQTLRAPPVLRRKIRPAEIRQGRGEIKSTSFRREAQGDQETCSASLRCPAVGLEGRR